MSEEFNFNKWLGENCKICDSKFTCDSWQMGKVSMDLLRYQVAMKDMICKEYKGVDYVCPDLKVKEVK